MEWILVGIRDDPVEETTSSQSLPLTLSPESVGLDGAMFTCRAVTVGGKVFEETVTIHVKGTHVCMCANHYTNVTIVAGFMWLAYLSRLILLGLWVVRSQNICLHNQVIRICYNLCVNVVAWYMSCLRPF